MSSLPLFIRKLIVDFVETGLAAVLALEFVFPGDINQAKAVAILFVASLAGALVAAVRRAVPAFLVWFKGLLGVTE